MTDSSEPTYHPEEIQNAAKDGRPVLVSRLLRYDHLTHDIPLGSVVEVEIEKYSTREGGVEVNLKGLCKLYVVGKGRDCDGTPLYTVSDLPVLSDGIRAFTDDYKLYKTISHVFEHGYSARSLKPTGTVVKMSTMREYRQELRSVFD